MRPDGQRGRTLAWRPDMVQAVVAGTRITWYHRRMAWILLLVAGVFEVVWAYAMKQSEGFTRPGATAVTIVALIASLVLLSLAMRTLPLGTAYTVWTGIGAVGAFVVGVLILGEAVTPLRLTAAALIITGLVTMKLAD